MGEVETLIELLTGTRDTFDHALAGLSPAQWTFKPGPTRWSIFEVTEHVATVESDAVQMVSGRLLAHPATEPQKAEVRGKDELILRAMKDRSRPREAPELLRPSGRWPSPAAAVAAFQESRERMLALLNRLPGHLRDYCAPHPILGMLDGYQWMLFVGTHLGRHTEQLAEIKVTPGFP
ncbi:MAG: DinB family protein [Gemmatimonadota bacterium]